MFVIDGEGAGGGASQRTTSETPHGAPAENRRATAGRVSPCHARFASVGAGAPLAPNLDMANQARRVASTFRGLDIEGHAEDLEELAQRADQIEALAMAGAPESELNAHVQLLALLMAILEQHMTESRDANAKGGDRG